MQNAISYSISRTDLNNCNFNENNVNLENIEVERKTSFPEVVLTVIFNVMHMEENINEKN